MSAIDPPLPLARAYDLQLKRPLGDQRRERHERDKADDEDSADAPPADDPSRSTPSIAGGHLVDRRV
jgi:hypothetical protein